jgi:DNA-binding transcriptional LysR family regulator
VEELAHIVTFTRVVKAGSFAGAARQLNVTDSMVSKHVAKLERSLGVRLLNRNTRKLSLTEAGTAYYDHCTRVVAELDSGKRAVTALAATPRGRLRVTVPVPIAATLGPLVREFLLRYPKVQIDLDASNRIVDLAEEGFDIAIRFARTLPPNVVARLLRTFRIGAFAAPSYLRRAGTPQHPADLAKHDCLNLPTALPGGIWPFVRAGEHAEIAVQGSVQSDMVPALHDLVRGGTGITLLPLEMAAPDVKAGRLVRVLPDWEMPPANLYAVYLPTRHLAPKSRAFIDFLVARMGQ